MGERNCIAYQVRFQQYISKYLTYVMIHSNQEEKIDFYKKMGFIEEARLKDHYYKGIDEVMMCIFLQ